MTNYEKMATDFLEKCNASMNFEYLGMFRNESWKEKELRNKYAVTITTGLGSHTFDFWDSIYNTRYNIKPTEYDVLACLTKYDPGDFEDFCGDFGYDADSCSAHDIYEAVVHEYKRLTDIFTDEQLEEMAEIN